MIRATVGAIIGVWPPTVEGTAGSAADAVSVTIEPSSRAQRLLVVADRATFWMVKGLAVIWGIAGLKFMFAAAGSSHMTAALLFLPIVPLGSWFLWRVRSLAVRTVIAAFALYLVLAALFSWLAQLVA